MIRPMSINVADYLTAEVTFKAQRSKCNIN